MTRKRRKSKKATPPKPRARRRFLDYRACPKCSSRAVQRTPSWAVRAGKLMMCMDCRFVWHAK